MPSVDRKEMKNLKRSPWAWIPTLYLAEGLPYVAVMTISVILYKRMGVSNTDIALYTSWLYLPWVIKPFWSPFVDLLKTKRWWIVTMQLLLGAGFAGIAFTIPAPFFFQATLAFFWLMAFSSATHDIAADGSDHHGAGAADYSGRTDRKRDRDGAAENRCESPTRTVADGVSFARDGCRAVRTLRRAAFFDGARAGDDKYGRNPAG